MFDSSIRSLLVLSVFFISLPSTPIIAGNLEEAPEEADLVDDMGVIKKDAEKMVESAFDALGKPAERDFHSRGVCLKGTFTTLPQNLPPGIQVALFSNPQTVIPMYGRFSNGLPRQESTDHAPSVFGFGIKLRGLPFPKFDMQKLGSTKPVNSNQDWNLATGRTFPIPTAAVYREFQENGLVKFGIQHPLIGDALRKSLIYIDNFRQISYHSQVAYNFGEKHVAKFSAIPCDKKEKIIPLWEAGLVFLRDKNYLTKDLTTYVQTKNICFKFVAQIRPNDDNLDDTKLDWANDYPDDNPTILWPKNVITEVELGEINFQPQPNVQKFQLACNVSLSINPGNTLEELRPIKTDTLNRARYLSAYEGSVTKRTSLNEKKEQWEPAGGPMTAEQLNKWLVSGDL
jgi:hypothetical protein